MPTFKYTAMCAQGKNHKGIIDAENENEANANLKERGLFPTSINKTKSTSINSEINIEPCKRVPRQWTINLLGFKITIQR